MSVNKHYLLSYDHKEIENILNRVYTGMLLTKEDYDYLVNVIGIKNISTFDGYYNSLIGAPDLDYLIAIAIAENNKKITEHIINEVDAKDDQMIELLEMHVKEYEKLINDLQTGLIKLDVETKDYINSSINELNKELKEQITDIESILENKSDKDHIHLIDEIYDLYEILELKSNISHTHDTEHVHTNKDLLDAINEFTIKKWDAKVDEEEIPKKLSELINDMKFFTREDLEKYLKFVLPDFKIFALRDDCDYFLDGKADKFHLHTMNQIEDLEIILSQKVDKEKGKVLIDKNLVKKIEEYLNKKENISDDYHVHENLKALDSITYYDILYWTHGKVDLDHMYTYVAEQLENYTTTELIKNYYTKAETYSREEVQNLIVEYGLDTINDRLGGLTFVPITQEEYSKFTEDDLKVFKEEGKVFILTDSEDIDIRSYIEEQISIIVNGSETIVTEADLDARLDSLTLKKIETEKYMALPKEEREREDVLYVITDTHEYNVDNFVTEETVRLLIEEAKLGSQSVLETNNRPENPSVGQCFFDTDLGLPIWFNGKAWVNAIGEEV